MQTIDRGENVWGNIGTSLGELAGAKLGQLLTQKKKTKERADFVDQWKDYIGEDKARWLSNFEPEQRQNVMSNLEPLMQLQQLQQQPQENALRSLSNSQGQMTSMQQQSQQPQGMQQFDRDYFIKQALGHPGTQQDSLLSGLQGMQQQPQQMQQPEQQQAQGQPQLTLEKAKLIADMFISPQERRAREKLELDKQAVEGKLNKEAREFSKPYREKARKAEANIRDYNDLINRAESGNLRAGTRYQILDKLGLQDFWRNPDTEIAQKLIARLAQNVNGVFGSNARIGVFLEKTFQRSLPSLINTPEGIAAISYMNKAVDEGELVRNEVRKQVLRENGGRVTGTTDDEIEERSAPLIQQIDENAARNAENAVRSKLNNKGGGKLFSSLPSASQFNGKTAIDDSTGQKFKSDGSRWIPIK